MWAAGCRGGSARAVSCLAVHVGGGRGPFGRARESNIHSASGCPLISATSSALSVDDALALRVLQQRGELVVTGGPSSSGETASVSPEAQHADATAALAKRFCCSAIITNDDAFISGSTVGFAICGVEFLTM